MTIMKRNNLPESSDNLLDDKNIIDFRLEHLISDQCRSIPVSNKGSWIDNLRHIRVNSVKCIPPELLRYSSDLKYHFLNPFEGLYCLETSKLIIYYNDLPLSVCEAYQLLLLDSQEFMNYRVYQQLNRAGYICLLTENQETSINPNTYVETTSSRPLTEEATTSLQVQNPKEDLLRKEVSLDALRQLGPQDCTDLELREIFSESLNTTFDVYKRGTFVKHKPRKGKQGSPDYRVVICDKAKEYPIGCEHQVSAGNRLKDSVGEPSGEVLYVLLDYNASICYAKFKPMNVTDMSLH